MHHELLRISALYVLISPLSLQRGGATGLERNFAYAVSDSDSEEETKRKVVSKKDKYTEELREAVRKLNNFIKISDWKSVKDGALTPLMPCSNFFFATATQPLLTPLIPRSLCRCAA